MQPEDIDKLFRDRLTGHAPTPPDHLWSQLQQEIQPAKKRPAMWLYAAAAAVALLLLVGGGWLLRPGSSATGPLATTQPARVTMPAEQPTAPTEKKADLQATAPAELASTPSNAPAQENTSPTRRTPEQAAPVAARPERLVAWQETRQSTPPRPTISALAPAPAAGQVPTSQSARPERLARVGAAETRVSTWALAAPVAAPTGPIVVEVRQEAEMPVVAASEMAADRPRHSRLGAVLRQARNAVHGDPVDLSKVGLPEALTVQARVGSHTLSKTIEL